eukprot:9434003-Alexandrium_andersonii.AAC.1
MSASLVGSEMCIRDRPCPSRPPAEPPDGATARAAGRSASGSGSPTAPSRAGGEVPRKPSNLCQAWRRTA